MDADCRTDCSKETRKRSTTESPIVSRRSPTSARIGVVTVDTCCRWAGRMPRSVQVGLLRPRSRKIALTDRDCRLLIDLSCHLRTLGARLLWNDHGNGQHLAQATERHQNDAGAAQAGFHLGYPRAITTTRVTWPATDSPTASAVPLVSSSGRTTPSRNVQRTCSSRSGLRRTKSSGSDVAIALSSPAPAYAGQAGDATWPTKLRTSPGPPPGDAGNSTSSPSTGL